MTSNTEASPFPSSRTAAIVADGEPGSQRPVRPLPAPARPWPVASASANDSLRPYLQGALALTYTLEAGAAPAHPGPPLLSIVPPLDDAPDVPDPQVWALRFVQAVMEVLASDRPLSQLARWTTTEVHKEIAARQNAMARQRPTSTRLRHQVSSVRVSQPHESAAEVAARVTVGRRSRVIAARLDFQRDRWLCTAVCFG